MESILENIEQNMKNVYSQVSNEITIVLACKNGVLEILQLLSPMNSLLLTLFMKKILKTA